MVAQQPDVTGLSNQCIVFVFYSSQRDKKAFIKQLLHNGRKTKVHPKFDDVK